MLGKVTEKQATFLKKFLKVHEAVNYKFILAKFHFFSFFVSLFKPFLTKYQPRWPMVPFTYDDLKNLVKSILQLYIKQSVIDNCSNIFGYKNIGLLNKSNIVRKKNSHLVVPLNLPMLN